MSCTPDRTVSVGFFAGRSLCRSGDPGKLYEHFADLRDLNPNGSPQRGKAFIDWQKARSRSLSIDADEFFTLCMNRYLARQRRTQVVQENTEEGVDNLTKP